MITNKGEPDWAFVIEKFRLIPLKYVTIPRLKLSAATVAVKLDQMIRKDLEYEIIQSLFWTDSRAALRYIYNENIGCKQADSHTVIQSYTIDLIQTSGGLLTQIQIQQTMLQEVCMLISCRVILDGFKGLSFCGKMNCHG